MTVNTDVSLTMPMNMLPMFGIAIFVACGRITWTKVRGPAEPERQPGLALAARDRLERRAVDLGDERAVEQRRARSRRPGRR